MQELSLNILDIAQNSIKAKASFISIIIFKDILNKKMTITIKDNGCGMTKEQVKKVIDPFYTTRTTRKVGLGVPFFKMSAEMTGGSFLINSEVNIGTEIIATYNYNHIDMMSLGDMASTIVSLISVNPDIEFYYLFKIDEKEFNMDTREIKTILKGLPINSNEVISFIKNYVKENQEEIEKTSFKSPFI